MAVGSPFHAFVSCAPEDNQGPGRPWGDWVEEFVKTYETPRKLVGRPTPFGPVPGRLSAARAGRGDPDERGKIEQSRVLIVVCSPAAAKSEVVREQVRLFKQLGRDRVVALIVAGEPDAAVAERECFPETLKYEVKRDGSLDREWRVHPIVADARAKGGGTAALERVEEAGRVIIAAVLGVPPNAIGETGAAPARRQTRGEEEGRPIGTLHARGGRSRFAWGLVLLCLAAAGAAGWYAYQMHEEKLAADAARRRADEVIVFLQRDLREKLAGEGRLDLLAEANERITQHLTSAARESKDPAAIAALADAYGDSAEIQLSRGNDAAALDAALQAAQARQRLADAAGAPGESGLRLVEDRRRVAAILRKLKRFKEALTVAEQGRANALALSRRRLGDAEVEYEVARTQAEVGESYLELGKLEDAARAFAASREILRALTVSAPGDRELRRELAQVTERGGDLKQRQGDVAGALTEFKEWQRVLAAATEAEPSDLKAQSAVAAAHLRVGTLLASQRRYEEAQQEFRKGVGVAEGRAKAEPANRAAQMEYINACRLLGAALAQGDPAGRTEAAVWFQKALDHLDRQFAGSEDEHVKTLRVELERIRDAAMGKTR